MENNFRKLDKNGLVDVGIANTLIQKNARYLSITNSNDVVKFPLPLSRFTSIQYLTPSTLILTNRTSVSSLAAASPSEAFPPRGTFSRFILSSSAAIPRHSGQIILKSVAQPSVPFSPLTPFVIYSRHRSILPHLSILPGFALFHVSTRGGCRASREGERAADGPVTRGPHRCLRASEIILWKLLLVLLHFYTFAGTCRIVNLQSGQVKM